MGSGITQHGKVYVVGSGWNYDYILSSCRAVCSSLLYYALFSPEISCCTLSKTSAIIYLLILSAILALRLSLCFDPLGQTIVRHAVETRQLKRGVALAPIVDP